MVDMSNMQSLAERMAQSPDRPTRVLDAVTALLRISDGDMAERTGWSRPTIQGKRTGSIRIKPPDIPVLALALDVPMGTFTMTVPEVLVWIADNRAEWFVETDGGDGGPDGNVVTLRMPAGVVQWDHGEILGEAA